MGLNLQVIASGGVVPIDDAGAITGYVNALPLAGSSAATANAAPAAYAPGGTPIAASGRVAYNNAAVAYVSQGTPYTADGRIATGSGPVAYYDQGMPYNAAGQLIVQAALPPITPADLFLAGELGCWLDPSDLSSLWQDSAGTIPVTGPGQPVGKITDKSGRGLHFTQATAGSRPLLQQDAGGRYYLDFDGVDDGYVSASTNFTAANGKVTIWAGVNTLQNGASSAGTIIEFSAASGANLNCFGLQGPAGDLNGYFWRSRGSGGSDGTVDTTTPVPPTTNVLCAIGDVAGDISTIRINSVPTTSNVDQGTGGYATYPFYLGRRGGTTLPFKGRMYGLIMRGTVTTTPQHITDIEQWMAAKTGISF